MCRLLIFVIALIATVVPHRLQAQPASYNGIDFTAEFAGGSLIRTFNYEVTTAGLGYSGGYRHNGATTTIYTYDARLKSIPDSVSSSVVRQQFEQARNEIRQAQIQQSGMSLASKGQFNISDGSGRPRLTCEGFEIRGIDPPRDTYLCLGVFNEKFLKFRTTMTQDSGSQSEARRFIGAWVDRLWKNGI